MRAIRSRSRTRTFSRTGSTARAALVLGAALLLVLSACGGDDAVTLDSGLKIEDTVVGDGAEATAGATITVHYTGTLEDGTKFDSSVDRGDPFVFTLGAGQVIRGWDEGFEGMKVGGKRILTIPPEMGYGATGSPPAIPPNSTLIFEVELLEVEA